MTLPLETAAISDQYARRALDNVAQQFPLAPTNVLGALPTTSATLPTGTYNGQDFYYQLGSGGGVWHFKYNLSSTKWDFAGGPGLYSGVQEGGTDETTTSLTYVALATAGPSIALPFAGDYFVEIGFTGRPTVGPNICVMSYDIGGTGAVDADWVDQDNGGTNISVARTKLKTGLSAVTLTAKYRVGGSTGNFNRRWMRVVPLRVG